MRKYVCDKCGVEFDTEFHWSRPSNGYQVPNLWILSIYPIDNILHPNAYKIGEYCQDCVAKIKDTLGKGTP